MLRIWSTLSNFCNNFVAKPKRGAPKPLAKCLANTHTQRTHTHTDIDSPVQHRVVPRIHSEALEKRKSNKLNWFVRSYFACSPHSPPPTPALPLPLPRPAHSSIALRFALLSSKVLWSFLSVFCNFPARFSAKVLKFAVRVL